VINDNEYIFENFRNLSSLQIKSKISDIALKYQKDLSLSLKNEKERFKEEFKRIRSLPLMLGHFTEMVDDNHAIVSHSSFSSVLSRVSSAVDREKLKPNSTIALDRLSSAVIGVIPSESDSEINAASNSTRIQNSSDKASTSSPGQIPEHLEELGGYENQQREIHEAMELPLIEPGLFKKLGIEPPKGILLYGPPGTGKTMAARIVAAKSNIPFIKVVASEFVQKYLGEGPRIVRDVFRLAREKAPCVIFIDEIDAIGQKRVQTSSGADREIQRILIEILTQMDGFDVNGNVKVIMATNRIDTLDPALLRPGRLDRKIEFGYPDSKMKNSIFNLYVKGMTLDDDVDLNKLAKTNLKIVGADIKAIVREAGIRAIRAGRYKVNMKDFEDGFEEVCKNIGLRTNESKYEFYR